MSTTVLESCRVLPPAGVAAVMSVPLSLFDYIWLHFHPTRHLLFYNNPSCSKPYFLQTLVPKLKQSLSSTLKHYLPVAGNLLYPLDTDKKPLLRYSAGDSVPLIIAESTSDFDELTGNHARDADQFYGLVPPMPSPVEDGPEYKAVSLFSVQVTLFPGQGICLGLSNHHALGDASSIVRFVTVWGAATRDDASVMESNLPVFDAIKDPDGIDSVFWEQMRNIPFDPISSFPVPTNRVRSSFTLRQADINKLKESAKNDEGVQVQGVSSFVVVTSYVWTCLAKSAGEAIDDEESEMFSFAADARPLMNPPVPANYFGNCLAGRVAIVEHKKLVGDNGFLAAAEAIAEEIKCIVNCKGELLKDAKNWLSSYADKVEGIRSSLGISGSPKFDWYAADFGWGKLRKVEVVSTDGEEYTMSLCKSMGSEGGLEVGLSLPRERMNAFQIIFANGLNSEFGV